MWRRIVPVLLAGAFAGTAAANGAPAPFLSLEHYGLDQGL